MLGEGSTGHSIAQPAVRSHCLERNAPRQPGRRRSEVPVPRFWRPTRSPPSGYGRTRPSSQTPPQRLGIGRWWSGRVAEHQATLARPHPIPEAVASRRCYRVVPRRTAPRDRGGMPLEGMRCRGSLSGIGLAPYGPAPSAWPFSGAPTPIRVSPNPALSQISIGFCPQRCARRRLGTTSYSRVLADQCESHDSTGS